MDRPLSAAAERAAPRPLALLRAWFAIGTQSVGGGSSTLFLMRLFMVERRRWMTQREFLEDWALSRLSPGVHMVALAGLLGRRVDGSRGAALAVLGMMVPAGVITMLLTAGYGLVRDEPLVRAALAGTGPVTVGMTIGVTYALARTAVRRGRRAIIDWLVVVASAVAGFVVSSPFVVIVAGALIGALLLGRERKVPSESPMA